METVTKYSKYWYLFLISIGICLGLGYLYIQIAPPIYSVSTTLLINEDKKGDGVLKETAFSDLNMFKSAKTADNEMQVLRSVNLFQQVFQKLSLQTRYSKDTLLFGKRELYGKDLPVNVIVKKLGNAAYADDEKITMVDDNSFKLTSKAEVGSKVYKFGDEINTPDFTITIVKGPAFTSSFKSLHFGFNNINAMAQSYSDEKLDIAPIIKDGNTVALTIRDEIPQRGLDILTTLVNLYNKQGIESRNKIAQASIDFIDARIKLLTTDLLAREQSIEQFKRNNMVTTDLGTDAHVDLMRGEDYKVDLQRAETQLNMVEAMERYFNKPGSEVALAPSTLGIQDATLISLITKFNDLQQDYQRVLKNNEPQNPLVVNIKDQILTLKQSIEENLKNVKNGLILTRNDLLGSVLRYDSRIKDVPAIEKGLIERNREQSAKETLYNYLIQKREETALTLSSMVPDARVIDSPNASPNPESPKKPLILLYAFLLGAILPIFSIKTNELLNSKVKSAGDLHSLTDITILGELSHNKGKRNLVMDNGSRTSISELFRYIRMNLNNNNLADNKVIMVTSSTRGEGKTFVSLNLGATLAMVNKKVVVLEFDLRKPDLLKKINLNNQPGISDYLNSDNVTITDILQQTEISSNMWVIGSGKLMQHPAEQLMNAKLDKLFDELKVMFDYVIIDTSPIGLVADAFSFNRYTDLAIYLIRYNYTRKDQLKTIEDIMKNNRLKNPMLIFNDAKTENLKNYGYASAKYTYEGVN